MIRQRRKPAAANSLAVEGDAADYAQIATQVALADLDPYVGTGNAPNTAAGRISHFLGLRGPAIALDTACSSSLVALHLACRSLRDGECDLAIVAGVNLILDPEGSVRLSRMRALSPDGRCRSFDARASGYARGEGVGVLVLRREADALRDHDRIWALVRGSAVNHDGRSPSLTAPNGLSQRDVIRRALADAGLGPDAVDYIEAHGTGTPLGDPIEARALGAVLGAGRDPAAPLLLGSVKTNIGHLEAAAGIAGVLKAALALAPRRLPARAAVRLPGRRRPRRLVSAGLSAAALVALAARRGRLHQRIDPCPHQAVAVGHGLDALHFDVECLHAASVAQAPAGAVQSWATLRASCSPPPCSPEPSSPWPPA